MIDRARRLQVADDLLRRFASALRATQLYSGQHPLVARNVAALGEALGQAIGSDRAVTFGIVGGEFVVGEVPLPRASSAMADLMSRLQRAEVERITVERDVTPDEVANLVRALALLDRRAGAGDASALPTFPHIQVGRIQLERRVEGATTDTAAARRLYREASTVAERLWQAAATEGRPDPGEARRLVDSLAQAVAENRPVLLALTAMKRYDNYTFTHMVNVSILTMAQARALGIDGVLLREFGLAGLMHDVGKVRTPTEILNKPDVLTPEEFEIIKRHVVDGAEILRRTPDMPALAPVVAFEHHLRADGSGYPASAKRPTLNLATVLCGIADVYDAMRSQRSYHQAFPTDRILAVLKRNEQQQFDRHLVRRFTQLLGIYPPATLVRLDSGETAVVLRVHAPDPYRPRVRVVLDQAGQRVERAPEINLWEETGEDGHARVVVAPVDPADVGLDPLDLL